MTSNVKTLNVTWDDHLQNLSGLFQELYDNKKLVDVTLYCSGGILKAHKIVLSACSPYFSKIFQEIDVAQPPIIILKGISYDEMHQLLEFMYKGSINILEQDLPSLIQAGSYLEIKGMDTKNIPDNLRHNLKRAADESVVEEATAKKVKPEYIDIVTSENAKVHDGTISRDSSPASLPQSDATPQRQTRFKGQKRVDVHFLTARLQYLNASPSPDNIVHKKGKSAKRQSEKLLNIQSDKKPINEHDKNEIKEKKPSVKKNLVEKKCDQSKIEEVQDDSISKIVIKDVYSTKGEGNATENEDSSDDENGKQSSIEEKKINMEESDQNNDSNCIDDGHLECSHCNMKFKNDNDLFCHEKVHTEEKPFNCDFCDLYFHRTSHLARHRRKHFQERAYECKLCDSSFTRADKLKTHIRQVHDDDYEPPFYLKKKYEFVEYTGEEKRPRGRPRKHPPLASSETPKEKRPRGRPRRKSCPAPGEPVENYDITNLPFGDLSMLTSSIPFPDQFQDLTITPVASVTSTALVAHTITSVVNSADVVAQTIATTEIEKTADPDKVQRQTEPPEKVNPGILSSLRQIGECTIQPVTK